MAFIETELNVILNSEEVKEVVFVKMCPRYPVWLLSFSCHELNCNFPDSVESIENSPLYTHGLLNVGKVD